MSVSHAQQTYPPEAEARAAVASALEWVGREVYGGDLSVGKRVEDVQQFCVVAPRQGDEGSLGRQQRESFFFLLWFLGVEVWVRADEWGGDCSAALWEPADGGVLCDVGD